MMELLNNHPLIVALVNIFVVFFSNETRPTQDKLLSYIIASIQSNGRRSLRYLYCHYIKYIHKGKISGFYYTLKKGCKDIDCWIDEIIKFSLNLIDKNCPFPIVLSVDDTLCEKYGQFFEGIAKLHDHAKHNGTEYLNGHCFVCLCMSIPVPAYNGQWMYISFPVAYRVWLPKGKAKLKQGYKNKLEIARDLCEHARTLIGEERNIIVLGDSWYPRGALRDFVVEHENVCGIFNVRIDTAMFDLPPERTQKRGRPAIKGRKLSLDSDFSFVDVPATDYRIAYRRVVTNLFGLKKVVLAVVTETKATHSRRLFMCTDPQLCIVDINMITDKNMKAFGLNVPEILSFCLYFLRWSIEVNFQEQKNFWGLSEYMLRSIRGIETQVNLQSLVYAVLCLLPYADSRFADLSELSIQERRYELGKLISAQLFIADLAQRLRSEEKYEDLAMLLESIARKKFDFTKTGS